MNLTELKAICDQHAKGNLAYAFKYGEAFNPAFVLKMIRVLEAAEFVRDNPRAAEGVRRVTLALSALEETK